MISPMEKIDQFVDEKMGQLTETSEFQNYTETYNGLEDWQQDIVKYVMMAIAILLPLLISLIFYSFYSSAKSELETYEEIIYTANQITGKQSAILVANSMFSSPIGNQRALEAKFTSLGVDSSNLRVEAGSFNLIELGSVNEVNADVAFQNLSSKSLYDLIEKMTFTAKMKVREINIKKDPNSNLLKGIFSISHYSKAEPIE